MTPEQTLTAIDAATVDVAGNETTYFRAGSGRPLLFLHGPFFPTEWTPTHEALSGGADVIAPLHPGYAEGGPPDWVRGFDDLVLHHRAFLDALDLERVDVVGYGLGAWMGANLAAFHPDRVSSLIAIAPMGLWVPEAPMFEFLAAAPPRVAAAVFNDQAADYQHLFPSESDIDAFAKAYGENGVTARLIWERRYDIRLERRLGLIGAPALVIEAGDDAIVPAAHARGWAQALPNARRLTVDGASHGVVYVDAPAIAPPILEFLAEVAA